MGLDIGFGEIRTVPIGGTRSGCIYMPTFCADVGLDADALWAAVQGAAFIPPEDLAAAGLWHVDISNCGLPPAAVDRIMSNKRMSYPTLALITAENNPVSNAISWHNDKPNSIAPESVMLDVSLGAGRTFHIRKNATTGEDITQVMAHGSAIAFTRSFNETYQHAALPPAMADAKPRASIVFRDIADVLNDAELVRWIAKAKAAKARRNKAKAIKRAN